MSNRGFLYFFACVGKMQFEKLQQGPKEMQTFAEALVVRRQSAAYDNGLHLNRNSTHPPERRASRSVLAVVLGKPYVFWSVSLVLKRNEGVQNFLLRPHG